MMPELEKEGDANNSTSTTIDAIRDIETLEIYSDSVVSLLDQYVRASSLNTAIATNHLNDKSHVSNSLAAISEGHTNASLGGSSFIIDPTKAPTANSACVNSSSTYSGIGIRGRANYSDSEEDDDDVGNKAMMSSSSSSSSLDSIIRQDDQKVKGSDEKDEEKQDADLSSGKNEQLSLYHPKKKKGNSKKKTKEELVKQMGFAPTSIVILGQDPITKSLKNTHPTSSEEIFALRVPSVLLPQSPTNYYNQSNDNSKLQSSSSDYGTAAISPISSLYNLSNSLTKPYPPTNKNTNKTRSITPKNCTLILILQSGKFAAAIFNKDKCIQHTTSTRYTTRKGQGGAQSSNDNAKGKAKSMGSQLRRAGEVQLRKDVEKALREWYGEIRYSVGYSFLSVSKQLQKGFWEDVDMIFSSSSSSGGIGGDFQYEDCYEGSCTLKKGGEMVRNIPLDVGRPSYQGCCAVYELMMSVTILKIDTNTFTHEAEKQGISMKNDATFSDNTELDTNDDDVKENPPSKRKLLNIPLTPWHEAARDGNVEELSNLLSSMNDGSMISQNVNVRAGPKLMTPLHYAAVSGPGIGPTFAQQCVSLLLLQGRANPCICDAHDRPPYYLATNDNIRNAFRKARAQLGEHIWNWDSEAKIGPPLTDDALQKKKEKAAEKKRRQRQRQKERKVEEKKAERLAQEEAEKKEMETDARRMRAGLKPKPVGVKGENVCDFCQKVCKGKRKSQMFCRLDFVYCSTDCVQKHKRELMAAAAAARFG